MKVERGLMGGGALLWLLQRVSGFVIAVLLIVHFIIIHYNESIGTADYSAMASRLEYIPWRFANLLFLMLVLFHGFNGFWTICQDYIRSGMVRLIFFSGLLIMAIFLFLVGAATLIGFSPVS